MRGLGVHELRLERFPITIGRLLFNDNLLVVVGELIDNEFDSAFAKFELVKGGDALGGNGDTMGWWSVRILSPWRNLTTRLGKVEGWWDGG